jgi:hypothetical protein
MIPWAWLAINFFGLATIAYFLLFGFDDNATIPGTLPLEMWYFVPAVGLASHALVLMLVCKFSRPLLVSLVLPYCICLVALADPWLCRLVGTSSLDLLTTPTLLFAATDAVFLGIGVWLEGQHRRQDLRENTKKVA